MMNQSTNEPDLNSYQRIAWRAPSNIALVKYWGKKNEQIPCNPSISLSLSKSYSTTEVYFKEKSKKTASRRFYFEEVENKKFGEKSLKLVNRFEEKYKELHDLDLIIKSKNTFPHSAGIASSASSMSSLSFCLMEMVNPKESNIQHDFLNNVSYFSRLGSGSACRSVYGGVVSWGENKYLPESKDEHASQINENIDPIFLNMRDSILIVSSEKKEISSTQGHSLMATHPHRHQRFLNAQKNYEILLKSMRSGDLKTWGEIVEKEALELHSLMMTSSPSFILMKPNTLNIINKVRQLRRLENIPVYFTLDAGPNIHLLYPDKFSQKVKEYIDRELRPLLEGEKWIDDCVGNGPIKLGSS